MKGREIEAMALLLFGLGAGSVLLVPPGQTPDEGYSFLRAYHLSEGHLKPEMVGSWGGGRFPPGVLHIVASSRRLVGKPEEKLTFDDWYALAALDWEGEPRPAEYPTAAPYSFVPFVPQAIGIGAARELGFGPLGVFYAGRFANLLFGTLLLVAAIARAPIGRWFFKLIALLPMTVHLLGSYAPEVGVIGASLLLPSLVLRIGLSTRRPKWWELSAILGCIAWIAASKPPYLPLAALLFAIPAIRFGSALRKGTFLAVTCSLGGGIAVISMQSTRDCYPDPNTHFGETVSVKEQTEFVKHHPEAFAQAFSESSISGSVPIWFRLFNLGWLDVPIHPLAVVLSTIALSCAAANARRELDEAGGLPRWPALLAVAASSVLIGLSLYLWCNAIGSRKIMGLHGRYLLPLLAMGALICPGWKCRLSGLMMCSILVASLAAMFAVVNRYYLA